MDATNDYDSELETPLGYVGKSTGPGQVYFDVVKTDGNDHIEGEQVVHSHLKEMLITNEACYYSTRM